MKVETSRTGANRDNGGHFTVYIDGKQRFCIGGGEPEDMSLGRDLGDAFSVPQLLQEAHAAGVRGELSV